MSMYDDIEDIFGLDGDDEMGEYDLKAYYCREWFKLKNHKGEMVLSCDNYHTMEVRP